MGAVSAGAAPDPTRAQAIADKRAGEYEAARARLDRVDAEIERTSAELETLVATQQALQQRLNSRAAGMYRGRRLDFVDVLTDSSSFAEFATRLEFLTRLNLQDARDMLVLKRTKSRVARSSAALLARQERASAELRRIEAANRAAQRELADSRAAYDRYLTRVRAAKQAPSPETPASTLRRPVSRGGGWKTAVASHYGSGSYGRRTADGTTIGPDSMIVAHKTLPFGTMVQFQYNGKTAVARVADRGPYTAGRTWDLGPGVIRILGFNGVDTVRYRILSR